MLVSSSKGSVPEDAPQEESLGWLLPSGAHFLFSSSAVLDHGIRNLICSVRYSGRILVKGLSGALRWILRVRQYPHEGLPRKPILQLNIFHFGHSRSPRVKEHVLRYCGPGAANKEAAWQSTEE